MATHPDSSPQPGKRRRLDRVTAACDLCKKRKTKCDGELPCAYCQRKNRAATCSFSATSTTTRARSAGSTPHDASRPREASLPRSHGDMVGIETSVSPTISRTGHHEDTVVPLEGRILRDAQGKVIFIGDCAPLSFLQTVRHLIASEVDPEGFPTQAVRDSIIEVAPAVSENNQHLLSVTPSEVRTLIGDYTVATSGLVDLFQPDELMDDMSTWADRVCSSSDDAGSGLFFLVLAVGAQEHGETRAGTWFERSRDQLVRNMCLNMNVTTVRGFILVAIYMLRAFQPNGAYLYFCKPEFLLFPAHGNQGSLAAPGRTTPASMCSMRCSQVASRGCGLLSDGISWTKPELTSPSIGCAYRICHWHPPHRSKRFLW